MQGIYDLDEPYPLNGTLEEMAVHSLNSNRGMFWMNRKNYLENREGGKRHSAILVAYGPEVAANIAKQQEESYRNFLKSVLLDENGNTTDPKYPIDKMVNVELRRIRRYIILSVASFFVHLDEQLPDDVGFWDQGLLSYYLGRYADRYLAEDYNELKADIPGRDVQPRKVHEVHDFLKALAFKYSKPSEQEGYSRAFLLNQMERQITEYVLMDIPYDNPNLAKKDEMGTKPLNKEEEKPILH